MDVDLTVVHLFFILPMILLQYLPNYFFFNATPTTEIYTLSLHDALPIDHAAIAFLPVRRGTDKVEALWSRWTGPLDRKSTRLNSSHVKISYAVFCLKKKK